MPEVYAGWRRVCSYFFCTKNRPPSCLFLDFCTHRVWYKPEIFVFGSCHVAVHLISSNVSDLGKSDVGYLQFPFVQKGLTKRKTVADPAVPGRRALRPRWPRPAPPPINYQAVINQISIKYQSIINQLSIDYHDDGRCAHAGRAQTQVKSDAPWLKSEIAPARKGKAMHQSSKAE